MTSNDQLDLDAIEARANAATPGPWCTDSWEIYQGTEYVAGAEWIGETCRGRVDGLAQDRADAAFVAAARTAVPELVAEVRRLRAELATANARLDATARLAGRQETKLRGLGAPATVDAVSIEAPQCDVEFEGGGRCAKAAGHRPPGSQDPHVPAARSAAV